MKYTNGTVLQANVGMSNEFLILIGYADILGDDLILCSCLVVRPYSDDNNAEIIGFRLVEESQLQQVSKPEWVNYINVSW